VFRIDKSVLQIRIRMVPHLDPDPHQSQNWSYYRCKTNFFFSGQGLFPAAAAARGADELWGLFWTEEMRELTITHTNRRIMKMMDAMGPDLLANDSGIGLVHMVSLNYLTGTFFLLFFLFFTLLSLLFRIRKYFLWIRTSR
jgi:hypothetical protein